MNYLHIVTLLGCTIKRKESPTEKLLRGSGEGPEGTENLPEEYPDWGPIYLSAASKAIILDWYRKAKNIRKEKREKRKKMPDVSAKYKEKVTADISDDEGDGDDQPILWAKQGVNITPATKAIAIKWNRTARARLQKKAGKGGGGAGRESDNLALQNDIKPAGTGFRSGLKSRNVRK